MGVPLPLKRCTMATAAARPEYRIIPGPVLSAVLCRPVLRRRHHVASSSPYCAAAVLHYYERRPAVRRRHFAPTRRAAQAVAELSAELAKAGLMPAPSSARARAGREQGHGRGQARELQQAVQRFSWREARLALARRRRALWQVGCCCCGGGCGSGGCCCCTPPPRCRCPALCLASSHTSLGCNRRTASTTCC